jgi:agmatinase
MSFVELFLSADPNISYVEPGVEPVVRILGVPFDYTSCYRPGSRFAPNAIRGAFQNIEIYSRALGIDLERLTIQDLGNMRHTARLEDMVSSVEKVTEQLVPEEIPLAFLGGEHSITYASFSAMPKNTGLVIFDAHLDLREEFSGLSLSHATFLRRLLERISSRQVFHIGGRAASKPEWEFLEKQKIRHVSPDSVSDHYTESIRRLWEFAEAFDSIYISVDLDGMDPAFAPGVGTPEPSGLSSQQFFGMLHSLKGTKISAFDIVELAAPFDSGTTAVFAAKTLSEISVSLPFSEKFSLPRRSASRRH